jgi:hypothetical protein
MIGHKAVQRILSVSIKGVVQVFILWINLIVNRFCIGNQVFYRIYTMGTVKFICFYQRGKTVFLFIGRKPD